MDGVGVARLMQAINIAYDEEESRSFLRRKGSALAFTVSAVVLLFIVIAVLPA